MAESIVTLPSGDGALLRLDDLDAERVRTRVTWYYYVGGLTQQEIADRLGLTRLKVNRIVGQARADGSVRIEVRTPLADCVALEEALKARYGLVEAVVVPSVGEDDQQRVIGEAAAALLDRLIVGKQSIGVGWGRTLSATVRRLPSRKGSGLWVVALMGGLTRGSGTNTFEVSTELTRMLDAECHYMAAPIYCPSVESRATLLTHYGLADVMRRAREVDIALVSCGDLSPRSNLAATQIVAENAEGLRKAGAVGDMLATYFDADGQPVDHPLNQRVMALPLADLRSVPTTILASGGIHKVAVIRGALAARYVNHLVTDEAVAQALL